MAIGNTALCKYNVASCMNRAVPQFFLQIQRAVSFIIWTPTNIKVSQCECWYRLVSDHPLHTVQLVITHHFLLQCPVYICFRKGLFHDRQCFFITERGLMSLAMSMVSTAHLVINLTVLDINYFLLLLYLFLKNPASKQFQLQEF